MAGFLNFTKALAANRSGIVLAALNLCYFVWDGFSTFARLPGNFDKIMIAQNSPAIILTIFSTETMQLLFSKPLTNVYHPFGMTVFLVFIILQWLFIGWAAKTIARGMRQKAQAGA